MNREQVHYSACCHPGFKLARSNFIKGLMLGGYRFPNEDLSHPFHEQVHRTLQTKPIAYWAGMTYFTSHFYVPKMKIVVDLS